MVDKTSISFLISLLSYRTNVPAGCAVIVLLFNSHGYHRSAQLTTEGSGPNQESPAVREGCFGTSCASTRQNGSSVFRVSTQNLSNQAGVRKDAGQRIFYKIYDS